MPVADGSISMQRIDQAVERVLTLKFRLGLFEHPYVDASKADAAISGNKDLARRASQESLVLLRNQNNVLPLSPNIGKIVVTGPNADNVSGQLGGWSVSWQGAYGSNQPCCAGTKDQIPPAITVLKGIKQAVSPSTQVISAPDQGSAVLEAAGKPVIVVVMAGRPLGLGPGENALLMAWQGGTETGGAVTDVLFGKVNPDGRLPVTRPSDSGDA